MPKAICKKCGRAWYGWALENPEQRTCECGGELKIEKEAPWNQDKPLKKAFSGKERLKPIDHGLP